MGLFGDNTKNYYNSVSTLLYGDTPPLIKQTTVATITQNRNIAEDLITNITNGIGYNANRLYNYGKSGNYPWGLPNGTVTHIAPQAMVYVKQVIESEVDNTIVMVYSLVDVDPDSGHIIYKAEYHLADNKGAAIGDAIYWEYDESTGTYPVLDIETADELTVSPYFPIVPIYSDQEYLAAEGKQYRQQITQACRYVNIKPDDIHEAITGDPEYGDNPIEDAFLVLALEVRDDSKQGMEYLYRFFSHQLGFSKVTKVDYDYWIAKSGSETPPVNRLELGDANYRMELGWYYIDHEIIAGTFLVPHPTDPALPDVPSKFGATRTSFILNGDVLIEDTGISYSDDTLIIRHQVDDNNYQELRIHGLVHSNWTVAKETRTTLSDAFGSGEDAVAAAFIIPLRKDVLNRMGNIKTHDVMFRSIRLVLNDKFVYKLKWYETGIFQVIVAIICIVITIYNPPLGIAAFSAAAVGIAIIQVILLKLLMPVVYKALQNILGEELALLVSVIASYYLGGGGISALANSGLQLATGLNSLRIANALEEINAELDVYNEAIEDRTELEALNQLQRDLVVGIATNDSYGILKADTYVRRFRLDYREPVLIRETTHQFTDILRFTDRPDSYIMLGHTGV